MRLCLSLLLLFGGLSAPAAEPAAKLNVLVVLSDDHAKPDCRSPRAPSPTA